MKVTLVVLSLACFIGALQAFPLEEEKTDLETLNQPEPQVLPNFEDTEVVAEDKEEEENVEDLEDLLSLRSMRPPQIHDNALRSQGPMSGRLTNVVLNGKGIQKTVQRNKIQFNVNAVKKVLDEMLENEDSE